MIERLDLKALNPQQRARVIYSEARSELADKLWRAALGDSDNKEGRPTDFLGGLNGAAKGTGLTELLQSMSRGGNGWDMSNPAHCHCDAGASVAPVHTPHAGNRDDGDAHGFQPAVYTRPVTAARGPALPRNLPPIPALDASSEPPEVSATGLGANARFAPMLEAAAQRTGLPASAIASIVDAEAAKTNDGGWNPHSRNPRSSAAGLGQFLNSTWEGMAEMQDTWLNREAAARGWLDGAGNVRSAARAELLSLRYDAQASIETTADFARHNLDQLQQKGIQTGDNVRTIARAAYVAHHLGLGDAMKFLGTGINSGRAKMLLQAQVGSAAAADRINRAGNATAAHQQWLLGYLDKRIRPERFETGAS